MSALRHHRVSGPSGRRLAGATPGYLGATAAIPPGRSVLRQTVTLRNDELLQSCASERF